jgi:hypothetical protein
MALKEITIGDGEQLMIPAIELGQVVREIASVEFQKREANADWNIQLKMLKKRMFKLAEDMKGVE